MQLSTGVTTPDQIGLCSCTHARGKCFILSTSSYMQCFQRMIATPIDITGHARLYVVNKASWVT